jgi:hypothetical protein
LHIEDSPGIAVEHTKSGLEEWRRFCPTYEAAFLWFFLSKYQSV